MTNTARVKEKLFALLQGRVSSVIRSLRHLETHCNRMKYDESLSAGYPIATGVIEAGLKGRFRIAWGGSPRALPGPSGADSRNFEPGAVQLKLFLIRPAHPPMGL